MSFLADMLAGLRRLTNAFVDVVEPVARLRSSSAWVAVENDGGDFDFYRRARRGATAYCGPWPSLGERQRATLAKAGGRAIEVRLAERHVISTMLKLPAEGTAFAEQIIEHRLDRLTPWPPEKVAYGFDVKAQTAADGQIDVEFAGTSREMVASVLKRLEAFGLAPSLLGRAGEPIERPPRIDLLRGSGDRARRSLRRWIARTAIAVPIILALVVAATSFLVIESNHSLAELDARAAGLRQTLMAGTGSEAGRKRGLALLEAKTPESAAFVFIDRLAKAIPVDTFLDQMEIGPATLHLVGRSTNPASLIGILEGQPNLVEARFSAPVTREDDGLDRFDITVSRAPRREIAP